MAEQILSELRLEVEGEKSLAVACAMAKILGEMENRRVLEIDSKFKPRLGSEAEFDIIVKAKTLPKLPKGIKPRRIWFITASDKNDLRLLENRPVLHYRSEIRDSNTKLMESLGLSAGIGSAGNPAALPQNNIFGNAGAIDHGNPNCLTADLWISYLSGKLASYRVELPNSIYRPLEQLLGEMAERFKAAAC